MREVTLHQKNYLTKEVALDLQREKPDLIIVNSSQLNKNNNILDHFLENPDFQEAWSQYQYVNSFGAFKVYQRVG